MIKQSNFAGFLDAYRASNISLVEPLIDASLKSIVESTENAVMAIDGPDMQAIKSQIEKVNQNAKQIQPNREEQLEEIGIALESLLDLYQVDIYKLPKLKAAIQNTIKHFLTIAHNVDSIVVKKLAISLGEKISKS